MSSHARHLDRYYVPDWALDMAHAADQPGAPPDAAQHAAEIISHYLRRDPPGICRARRNAIEEDARDTRATRRKAHLNPPDGAKRGSTPSPPSPRPGPFSQNGNRHP